MNGRKMQSQDVLESRSANDIPIARLNLARGKMRQTAREYLRLVLPLLLAWSVGASAGGGSQWIETGAGAWIDPLNWSPERVPDANFGDEPTIDNGGTAQIAGTAAPTFGILRVGVDSSGSVEISGGGALDSNSFGIFGRNSGSSGTLDISGAGSSLTLFRELRFARLGSATVVIENGGALTSNTSGSMIDTILAENTGSIASVTIQGAGSSWQANDDLRIAMPPGGSGSGGAAELIVAAGGTLSSNGGALSRGVDADATVTVTGNGSEWNANGSNIFVGSGSGDNPALLVVEEEGRISARDIVINPADTQPENRKVRLGNGAVPGVLNVQTVIGAGSGGGVLEINHDAADYYLTTDGTAGGTPVALEAGLTVNHIGPGTTISVADLNETSGTFNIDAGKFIVEGTFFAGGFFDDPVFNVNAGGTLSGNGRVADVSVASGGIIAPGRSIGTLRTDDLTLADNAVLEFELSTPGTIGGGVNDLIEGVRNLTLHGVVNITAVAGFDAGTYRLINYSEDFADNGLAIGTAPAGFSYSIDTATEGEVNLVVTDDSGTADLIFADRFE